MKVVALVSGGKDSCFSMHLCQTHGHEVVALGNLLPTDSTVDELDSYMYQTVGHQLVAAYASCTGLPLYRRRITGSSCSQGLAYSATVGDEVEDLLLLLAFIKEAHPDVQAVASGAIASDYQRLRVESVCSRLGLVSLGYLWHQPQDQLLSDMISTSIHAVLVKVAALGLDPHKHLGKSIAQLQPHLRSLRDRFGCNVCGEGGEYETLTLDCPAFKHGRIMLDEWQVLLHSPDSIAPVGVLHPTSFHIEPKSVESAAAAGVVEMPADWRPSPATLVGTTPSSSSSSSDEAVRWDTDVYASVSQRHVHVICSASRPSAAAAAPGFAAADTAAALDAALSAVSAALARMQDTTSWQLSCFVHLYLADMAHFAAANAVYCRHLPQLNPPSRACVQVPLPAGVPVLLDVIFARSHHLPEAAAAAEQAGARLKQQQPQRSVLHVQSISDWAPSCIGPYSQATSCNGVTHMAGQIPLDPGSMNMLPAAAAPGAAVTPHAVAAQVWRTLCSCQAVAIAVKGCFATASLGLVIYLTAECAAAGGQQLVQAALAAVRQQRSLLDEPHAMPAALAAAAAAAAGDGGAADPHHMAAGDSSSSKLAAGVQQAHVGSNSARGCVSDDDDGEGQAQPLDDYLLPPAVVEQPVWPAVVYLTVPALPRGALLEVQPLLLHLAAAAAAQASTSSSDEDEDEVGGCSAPQPHSHQEVQLPDGVQGHSVRLLGGSSWSRHVVLLQECCGGSSAQERATQAAAAAEWLSAALTADGNQPGSAGSEQAEGSAVSLRCWYDVSVQPEDAAAPGWRTALASGLASRLATRRGGAVQFVPVLGASVVVVQQADSGSPDCGCAAGGSTSWAVMEALAAG